MKRDDAQEFTEALGQVFAGGMRLADLADGLGVPAALGLSTEEWLARRLAGEIKLAQAARLQLLPALKAGGVSNVEAAKVLGVTEGTVRNDLAKLRGEDDERPVDTDPSSQNFDHEERLARLAELDEIDARRAEREAEREVEREHNRELVRQAPRLADLDEQFPTIVLDPPWDWSDEGDADQFGRARPTYATMPIEDIAAEPVGDRAQDNAHLYLWITNRSLPKGFALLERWGFRYVTAITWVKPSIGMGNYFRGSTEHVLFGVRGSLPLLRADVGTHLTAPRPARHSQKPDEFYELVEACSPGPWLDWPARQPRDGWVAFGAEVAA